MSRDFAGFDDLKRFFFSRKPRDVSGIANTSAFYYRQYMLKKVFAVFDYDGFPDNWDTDYFNEHLFLDGVICVTDTPVGIVALKTGYTGINLYNHPTECVIANPVLGNFRKTIGEDCVLIKLQYDYKGIYPILDRYSYMLAACDESIAVNLVNSKVAAVFRAESRSEAQTIKAAYDKISEGSPMVIIRDALASKNTDVYFNHVKENFIASDVELLKHMIVNDFLTEIGVANANSDKRERVQSAEVEASSGATAINIQHWLDNIKQGFTEVNKMFGLNISVKIREEVKQIEPTESIVGTSNATDRG